MSLRDLIPSLTEHVQKYNVHLRHNNCLFNIYEGDLLTYVEAALRKQLSEQSFETMRARIAPVNILRQIVDKLSKIYGEKSPVRSIVDGTDTDAELLSWYEEQFQANQKWNIANEFFNLQKSVLVEPFVDMGRPCMRSISADRFLPFSTDEIDPTRPTVIIIVDGYDMDGTPLYRAYTDDEFVIFDADGMPRRDLMAKVGNPEGVNVYGKIKFVYINRSHNLLVPKIDTDTLQMTTLIPVLMSDLNYISMFQAFSIMYGIDVDDKNLVMSPNAFWQFKSDGDGEKKPEVGSIKPDADIDNLINLIGTELSFWLKSRGIRPGSIGSLSVENAASGISKIIDEMDTSDERQKSVEYFSNAEASFWELVMHYMHPYWVANNMIERRELFTPGAKVALNYAEQIPFVNRGQIVATLRQELEAGFTSRRRAIKKLNPKMSEDDIDELIKEIDEERFITDEQTDEGQPDEI